MDRITSLLDQTIRYTRDLTFEISPPVLYELGLPAALDWLAERFQSRHGLSVTIQHADDFPALSDDVRITLMKSVQELLTNVVKHARRGAGHRSDPSGPGAARDRGRGQGPGLRPRDVDLGGTASDHFGLFSIRERLEHLGGRLGVRSAPGFRNHRGAVAAADAMER